MSLEGDQQYFVAYDYDNNYIVAEPVQNLQDATVIEAFEKIFTDMEERGHKPVFNVTDNQATVPLKEYLKKKGCK